MEGASRRVATEGEKNPWKEWGVPGTFLSPPIPSRTILVAGRSDGTLGDQRRREPLGLGGCHDLGLDRQLRSSAEIMKADIHPKYHETQVTCGCGNSFSL